MDSLFFNITERRYKREEKEGYVRVDISDGVLFFESKRRMALSLSYLDRMLMLVYLKNGHMQIRDRIAGCVYRVCESQIYASCRQEMEIVAEGEVFVLFIADFFLKRYLADESDDPVDYLYRMLQQDDSLKLVDTKSIDALSLFIIDKITRRQTGSMRCEHDVIELIIHRFGLLDIFDGKAEKEELAIARKAKNHLLKSFVDPPTIHTLAHLCATNDSKLKKSFKKVYKTTIYRYIQKLRMEEANLLLKEENLSIAEVAARVGYRHQGHFSKLFFQTYGIYPKDLVRR